MQRFAPTEAIHSPSSTVHDHRGAFECHHQCDLMAARGRALRPTAVLTHRSSLFEATANAVLTPLPKPPPWSSAEMCPGAPVAACLTGTHLQRR